jgi:hypothetical protein
MPHFIEEDVPPTCTFDFLGNVRYLLPLYQSDSCITLTGTAPLRCGASSAHGYGARLRLRCPALRQYSAQQVVDLLGALEQFDKAANVCRNVQSSVVSNV